MGHWRDGLLTVMSSDPSDLSNSAEDAQPSQSEMILGRPSELGPAEASGICEVEPKWRGYYEKLLRARDELLAEHQRLGTQAANFDPKDMMQSDAESATDESTRDYALGMITNYQERLEEIDAAIQRIHDGAYGICERTGEPIPAERLNAVPWTRFRTDAETELEEEGEAPVEPANAGPQQPFGPPNRRIRPGKEEPLG